MSETTKKSNTQETTKEFKRLRELSLDEIKKEFTEPLQVKVEKRENKKRGYVSYAIHVTLLSSPLIQVDVDSSNIDAQKFLNLQMKYDSENQDVMNFTTTGRYTEGIRMVDGKEEKFNSIEFVLHDTLRFSALIGFYVKENLEMAVLKGYRKPINWIQRGVVTAQELKDVYGNEDKEE